MYKVHALCVHGIFGFQDSSDFATLWYFPYEFLIPCIMMMMIAFITINSGLVPLIEGLCDVWLWVQGGKIYFNKKGRV